MAKGGVAASPPALDPPALVILICVYDDDGHITCGYETVWRQTLLRGSLKVTGLNPSRVSQRCSPPSPLDAPPQASRRPSLQCRFDEDEDWGSSCSITPESLTPDSQTRQSLKLAQEARLDDCGQAQALAPAPPTQVRGC
jgi:hypothetical protein